MIEVDAKTFETEVLQAPGRILVDFYGEGCVPCMALMPHIHELESVYGDQIKFCAINTNLARRLAFKQKVVGMPTIAVYENGVIVDSCIKDDATPEKIEAMIRRYI